MNIVTIKIARLFQNRIKLSLSRVYSSNFLLCFQGMSSNVLNSGMIKAFFKFLKMENVSLNATAFEAANLIYNKVRTE